MTREDIIRMAREASFTPSDKFLGCLVCNEHSLERFANLIAAAEREECAQAAGPEDSYCDEWFAAKADSAKRIRARGQA
jgi:hypothetical protein